MALEIKKKVRRTSGDRSFRKNKGEIEKEAIRRLIQTIYYYMSDPVTAHLYQTELLEERPRNNGVEKDKTKEFVGMCKEELSKIKGS